MMPSHSLVIEVSAVFLLARYALAGEVSLIDGDGLRIGNERIRLWGIDSVELNQQCTRDKRSIRVEPKPATLSNVC
jgi:endonuclease YncB( thermonuclease family)